MVRTMPTTATANSRTNRPDSRLTWRWRSKKFMTRRRPARRSPAPVARRQVQSTVSEGDPRCLALARLLDLEQRGRLEPEHVGDEVAGEGLPLVVVVHHRVVEVLPGEGDLVLGRGELL